METNQNISKFREREFVHRNSVLTDIFDTKQGAAVYNFTVNLVILTTISTIGREFLQNYSGSLLIKSLVLSFENFHMALLIWAFIFGSIIIAYKGFWCWAVFRNKAYLKCKCWDWPWMLLFISYIILILCSIPFILRKFQTHFVASFFITIEEMRLLMKLYAFVRSNVPRATEQTLEPEQKVIVPDFKQFLYYLFAPTFVYRDSYPRTDEIRYKFIIYRFLEVAGCIYVLTLLAANYFYPFYFNFGSQPYTWQSVISLILTSLLSGPVIVFTLFILVLHSWQNAFAEMLRFADRKFYSDWWTCKDYVTFFRAWNTLVHDFLYNYVYRDLHEIVFSGNRAVSMLAVFVISSSFHEYVMTSILGFFCPLLFIFFCSAIFFTMCKKYTVFIQGNLFILWSHTFGNALLFSSYCVEYFVRVNCPRDESGIYDFFVPRVLSCSHELNGNHTL